MSKVTPEEVQEALAYLGTIQKGNQSEAIEEKKTGGEEGDGNGGSTEEVEEMKKALAEKEEEVEEMKKSLVAAVDLAKNKESENGDLKKSLNDLGELVKSQGNQLGQVHELLEKVAGQPLGRKSATSATALQKSFSGEGGEDPNKGKTVISKSRQRMAVSDALFQVFEKSNDSRYEHAVAAFEAGNSYIEKSIVDDLNQNHNIVIVD